MVGKNKTEGEEKTIKEVYEKNLHLNKRVTIDYYLHKKTYECVITKIHGKATTTGINKFDIHGYIMEDGKTFDVGFTAGMTDNVTVKGE